MLTRKKQPELQPRLDLDRLLHFKEELLAVVEQKVDELKASPDGRDLPREILKRMVMHGGTCLCSIVNNILDKESK